MRPRRTAAVATGAAAGLLSAAVRIHDGLTRTEPTSLLQLGAWLFGAACVGALYAWAGASWWFNRKTKP